MQNSIPYFKYHLTNPFSEKYRGIEVNGKVIHWVEDVEKFYGIFGFTQEMRKAGVLPDEYIWAEYTNRGDFNFTACLQVRILEYLNAHSKDFLHKNGSQCEKWLAELRTMRNAREDVCVNCKIKPSCSN